MNKRVLVITYHFPPRPSVGSLRLKGLAKYLPEFGWEPVILTATLPGKPEDRFKVVQTFYPGDVTARWKKIFGFASNKGSQSQSNIIRILREDRTPMVNITRKIIRLIRGIIIYPDNQKGWHPFALKAGQDLLKNEAFDALISSSGPVTSHIIAKDLKAQFGIPWIADLRDLWTQNPYYPYGPLRRLFERRLELRTLGAADALVTVSEPLAQKLRSLHRGKFVIAIPNGYDPDEVGSAPLTKEFTITYTGRIYVGKQNPTPLFRAIAELTSEGHIDRRTIKIRFYGTTEYWLEKEIKRFGLEDLVHLYPRVSRDTALEKQRESQVLLLLNWDDPREVGIYTGKVFEYLAAQRPILAIGGPKGVVSELLEETEAGVHVSGYEHLKRVLVQLYEEYRAYGYVPYKGRQEQIAKYSHREMARKFAKLLNSILLNMKENNKIMGVK